MTTTELERPFSFTLPCGATTGTNARHKEATLHHELLGIQLALPYRVGGMAVRTPDQDVTPAT